MIRIPHNRPRGFSLIEVLVSVAVMALLLAMTLQILGSTSAAIKAADKQRNATSQLRTALDRFAADFSTAMLTGGGSMIWFFYSAPNAVGSQVGFVSRSRSDGSAANPSDKPRGAAIGYSIDNEQVTIGGTDYSSRELKRGDGLFSFADDLAGVFAKMSGGTGTSIWKKWEPVGTGIVRFHVSFVLDDGTITQIPPVYSMTSPQDGDITFLNGVQLANGRQAVAFSESSKQRPGINGSDPANDGRYVKALLVAAACVDKDIRNLALTSGKLSEVAALGNPAEGQTPLEAWEENLKDPNKITFLPLRQNLRFQQRMIPIP